MLYVLYSTSNSDYQSWQCKLLEWSFKKVNQPGKLIRLCSFNTHAPNRKFDTSEISEVIKLPDYRTRWTNYTKNLDKDYGIVNKTESLKYWLKNYKGLKDSDNVLLIDPDMVFQHSIDIKTTEGIVVAQQWIDNGIYESNIFKKYAPHIKHKINASTVFMYPYIITVGDLKKIINTYTTLCYKIRLENYPDLWESEMFSLIIAAAEKLTVKTIPNLGLCINWSYNKLLDDKNFVDNAAILHYTSNILDVNDNKIFNKQNYTEHTLEHHWKIINSNNAKNYIERKFLNILENYNISKLNNFYWKDNSLIDSTELYSFTDAKKYIVFNPWKGGFNNVRMSLEIAACIAYLTNRILVIPEPYRMYLQKNVNNLYDFFDINDIGINTISFESFKKLFGLKDYNDLKQISYVISNKDERGNEIGDTVFKIKFTGKIENKWFNNRKIIDIDSLKNENIIFFDSVLLGNFYTSILTDYLSEMTKYVCRNIHYTEEILNEAYKAVQVIGKNEYYSVHIRRGDFQYKDLVLDIEEIYKNIQTVIPKNSKIYISTDEVDKEFFSILKKDYQLYFYDDIKHVISTDINVDLVGPIEQIICANAITFIGNKLSTFSSYIYRLRGYMENISDKRCLLYQSEYSEFKKEEDDWWVASWAREYSIVWESIKNIKFFDAQNFNQKKEKIFVSIASYRDPQLVETINSIFKNKSNLYEIIIGVCMQDTLENYENFKYKNDSNVKIEFIDFKEAKGVCWARNLIQEKLFSDEDYYLQIDSHSRVCKDWDKLLVEQLNKCVTYKPILSTYPNGFNPDDTEESYFNTNTSAYLKINQIYDNKKIHVTSAGIVKGDKPIIGFWIAAGFLFTKKEWVKEVKYTTDFYFVGEEDYLSVKSFNMGWDVFIPEKSTVWHDYTDTRIQSSKKYRPLHWEDHPNRNSNEHLIEKLYEENNSNVRSCAEFLNRAKKMSKYTEPKVLPQVDDSVQNEPIYNDDNTINVSIIFDWQKIQKPIYNKNVRLIVFAFENGNGLEIFRPDIYDKSIINRTKNNLDILIEKNIYEECTKCIWFYGYEDGSFDNRMKYNIVKNGNKFFI